MRVGCEGMRVGCEGMREGCEGVCEGSEGLSEGREGRSEDRETVHEVSRRDWVIHKNHTIFTLSWRELNTSRRAHGVKRASVVTLQYMGAPPTRGHTRPRVHRRRPSS